MSRWICNRCKEQFEDPLPVPEYVDDSRRIAYATPVCPYCHSEDIDEFWEEDDDPEDEDESTLLV